MNKRTFRAFFLAATTTTLFGCAAIAPPASKTAGPRVQNLEGANIQSQLLETANAIDESLKMLAASKAQYHPEVINTEPLTTQEGGMGGRAAIDWSGPVEPLLEKVAAISDYRVKYLGHPPAVPIVVSISDKEAVVADILKNAGLQAAKRANIVVYPESRIIELRYASLNA